MNGDFYYNDLDSSEIAARGYEFDDEALDEHLIGTWDDDSPAHQMWMSAEQADISSALSYFESSEDSFASLDDFDDLGDLYVA